MDREQLKTRIREDMLLFVEQLVETKRRELHARGRGVSLLQFLDALAGYYPKAEVLWLQQNAGLELSEEYVALRREVYLEVVAMLKLRASN